MNELVVADKASEWRRLKALVLDSVSSPITRRVYNLGLDEFIAWYTVEFRPAGFTKATVMAWRVALEARKLGPISINVRITAVRKLAVEAADNGLLAPEPASGISRIKGVPSHGVRVGNWLSLQQAQRLLNIPDVTTKKGLRDRAMFATLLGCGLRRSELAALTMKHVQMRDSRWCIVDLVGKHGRVRTIPMPAWVKTAIDAWKATAEVTAGHLFRPVNRGDQVCGERMSEKVVWQMLKTYVAGAGLPDIAPHDLRRTTAKGSPLPAALSALRQWECMTEYRHSAHAVFDLKYHVVWCTKYRYKIVRGRVAERARDLIRQICQARDVVIVRGAVSPDHIHLLLSAPPVLSPAKLAQYIKGRSSRNLQAEFPELRKRYWGQHMWARGYFCATVGAVDEATIKACIESQKWDEDDQGFRITAPTEP